MGAMSEHNYKYDHEQIGRQCVFLANRLKKQQAHLSRWLRRNEITCYRIYDKDIPEIPLAIDVYEDMLHIAEYRTFAPDDAHRAAHDLRMQELIQAAAFALAIPEGNVFYKIRQKQKGKSQYTKNDSSPEDAAWAASPDENASARVLVHEGGLRFFVHLHGYIDTGLFLDHRETRALVRASAAGKRVLNLFAYTGAFSIYALDGGAAEVVSVDLSNTYLDWIEDNHRANFPDKTNHTLVRADVLEYVYTLLPESFDIIIADPPTFSSSKAMQGSFDVMRDHAALLASLFPVLKPGGALYFSTNRARFALDPAVQTLAGRDYAIKTEDIGIATIPRDFRNRRIHSCWRFTRGSCGQVGSCLL
jgi:23S rRNA (cytosine1962-C5)-methyltransferase